MHSFGLENEWQLGVDINQLFERCCFLSILLKREEFIKTRITKENRDFFDDRIRFMIAMRTLIKQKEDPNKICLRTSGES